MRVAAPYQCDYCPEKKGLTNHWHLRIKGAAFMLIPWDELKAEQPEVEHICSESCAIKALSLYMAKRGEL